ncbi:SRPBCC family protein [Crocinitomicaceae bacterium]|nr:SRPBCC family protein [Crocinitomicaceae bacterium]
MAFYQIKTEQRIPAKMEEVWEFMRSPKNLKKITPEHMGFDVITKDIPDEMYPGMIIAYKVSPLFGIKMTWVTEITHVEEGKYFVDEQRVGPYKVWHHEHFIREENGEVVMSDIVTYIPPFGFIGAIANSILIKKQLKDIFDFRFKAVEKEFGESSILH